MELTDWAAGTNGDQLKNAAITDMSESAGTSPRRLASITRRQASTVMVSPRSFAASRTLQAISPAVLSWLVWSWLSKAMVISLACSLSKGTAGYVPIFKNQNGVLFGFEMRRYFRLTNRVPVRLAAALRPAGQARSEGA